MQQINKSITINLHSEAFERLEDISHSLDIPKSDISSLIFNDFFRQVECREKILRLITKNL